MALLAFHLFAYATLELDNFFQESIRKAFDTGVVKMLKKVSVLG